MLEAVLLCPQLDDLHVDELLQQWPDNVGALSGSTLVEAKVVDLVLGCPSSTLRGCSLRWRLRASSRGRPELASEVRVHRHAVLAVSLAVPSTVVVVLSESKRRALRDAVLLERHGVMVWLAGGAHEGSD